MTLIDLSILGNCLLKKWFAWKWFFKKKRLLHWIGNIEGSPFILPVY
jgi:hypothetical protein